MHKELKGFFVVLSAALLWGGSSTVAKIMFNQSIDPLLLTQVRMTASAILLWTFLFIIDKKALWIRRQDLGYFIILGIPGLAALQFTYLFTISQTNVGTAVFLQYFAPIFTMLYVLARGQEPPSRNKLLCLAIAFIGCFLILFGGQGLRMMVNIPGLISGIASAIFMSFFTIYSRKHHHRYAPLTVLTYAMIFGAVFWSIIVPPWTLFTQGFSLETYGFFMYIVLFSTVIPFGLYSKGISLILPSTATIIALTEPVFAVITAYFILNEKMTPVQIIGGALVLSSIGLLQYLERKI